MSRTYRFTPEANEGQSARWNRRHFERQGWTTSRREELAFRCRQCKLMVWPPASGGRHRNHCPYCLISRHVDGTTPGDRASTCGGTMAPKGTFTRPNGEHVLVHRCLTCVFERHNRVASDDDFHLVLSLPRLKRRVPK